MRKIILFDLDGTLLESGEGIIKSLQYASKKMGLPQKDEKELRVFIGPPLLEQLMTTFSLSQGDAEQTIEYYRERYSTKGMFESSPYEGIENLLKMLKDNHFVLGVSSSKPENFVNLMLSHFNLAHYFTETVGSDVELDRDTKAAVIKETLKRFTYNPQTDQVIMVGDKEHDVLGAREEGIDCISVLYGYGSLSELEAANPLKIVPNVSELEKALLDF